MEQFDSIRVPGHFSIFWQRFVRTILNDTTSVLTVFLWSLKFSLYVGNRYFIWSLVWGRGSGTADGIGSVEEGDGIPEPIGMGHIRFPVGFGQSDGGSPSMAGKSEMSKQGA